jgi:hypothetical protein
VEAGDGSFSAGKTLFGSRFLKREYNGLQLAKAESGPLLSNAGSLNNLSPFNLLATTVSAEPSPESTNALQYLKNEY